MFYIVVSAVVVLLSLLALAAAGKLLFRKGWFLGWLRGTLGVLICIIAGACALAAFDLFSYKQIIQDKPIATIRFTQVSDQNYQAELDWPGALDEAPVIYKLNGDHWQLDARIIRWHGFIRRMGAKPGYRLERISGRYQSLDDEQNKTRTVHGINEKPPLLDVWALLNKRDASLAWVDAEYGNATFLPMVDQARYEVFLTDSGLIARPLNAQAIRAVSAW